MTQDQTPTLTQELSLLERKRRALIRVVNISGSLERLRLGYEAMLHLGQSDTPLPISAMQLFDHLGRKIRNLSDAEVKVRLAGLDKKLLRAQSEISDAIPQLANPQSSDEVLENFSQQIRDFQRIAHTNIALRVLIGRRHIELPPLKLNIPVEKIKANITTVSSKERNCRTRVRDQIQSMRVEIQRIIHGSLCSETQKQILAAMDEALKENIEHIQAGKSINELPTPVEDFQLNTVANQTSESTPLPHPIVEESGNTPAMGQPQSPPQSKDHKATAPLTHSQARPKGLVKRFKIWLSTPWNVGWRDIDMDQDKNSPPAPQDKRSKT
ncbi:hypothetical protein BTA51_04195 [Hahella sp. CCB-MM4]|uniref:hypothetical protein n=1 Tax=Hahella sp. (strain CCB-MM4) TaxID=1926491 RepID=UPI000B9B6A71|nr:hypothetical protein [Hahella sp. CCB-MM4]OZG74226.1 hypothetical protein BTA51_04195 [Hahella sp. CCB-MM4]